MLARRAVNPPNTLVEALARLPRGPARGFRFITAEGSERYFSYEAIGVPRNAALPANADPGYVDLGLCGPARTDHPPTPGNRFCGMFKSPTLRNVASRRSFFHNGIFHSLEQTIRFYNTRDTMPELWYPTVGRARICGFAATGWGRLFERY